MVYFNTFNCCVIIPVELEYGLLLSVYIWQSYTEDCIWGLKRSRTTGNTTANNKLVFKVEVYVQRIQVERNTFAG